MGAFEDAARLDRKNEFDLSYCATAPSRANRQAAFSPLKPTGGERLVQKAWKVAST